MQTSGSYKLVVEQFEEESDTVLRQWVIKFTGTLQDAQEALNAEVKRIRSDLGFGGIDNWFLKAA